MDPYSTKSVADRGLSYIVGVLLVLGITIAAVAVYTNVTGFQSQIVLSVSQLDIKRMGESLVVVEYHRPTSTLVIYNNGLIATCLVEIYVVGMGSPVYSNPSCTPIPPQQVTTINLGLVNPPQKFTLIARTTTNKILTYSIG